MVLAHPVELKLCNLPQKIDMLSFGTIVYCSDYLDRLETGGAFPLWLSSFGHMRTQKLHPDVEQNNSLFDSI